MHEDNFHHRNYNNRKVDKLVSSLLEVPSNMYELEIFCVILYSYCTILSTSR